MVETIGHGRGILVLRGVCAILFGLLAFLLPGITLASLVLLWGAYALVNGVLALVMAVRAPRGSDGRATTALMGVLGIAAGILTAIYPGITALTLLLWIAAWAVITGIFEVIAAVQLRRLIPRTGVLAASGVLSILFGVLLFARPGAGALSIVWLIGAYAIAFGALMLAFGFTLGKTSPVTPHPAAT